MAAPRISSARNYPYPCTIEVFFDQQMLNNTAIISPSSYNLNLGAYVTSVEALDNPIERVRLTVENLFGYPEFILSIGDGLLFSTGAEAFDITSTATILIDMIDEGIYALSASNGRLKTGKEVRRVAQDDEFFYIMTEAGVDVVDKTSLFNKGYTLHSNSPRAIFISGD